MAVKKGSSPLPKILIVVVILIVLGAAAFFVLGKGKFDTTANPLTAVKDSIMHSGTMHCEFKDPQGRTSKAEIKNGAIRLDYEGMGEEKSGSYILKNDKMWMWSGNQGYIFDEPKDTSSTADKSDQSSQKDDIMKEMEQYKDSCRPGIVADTVFDPPGDVTFQSMSEMLKEKTPSNEEMQQMQQKYMQSAPSNDSSTDNSTDNSSSNSDY